MLKIYVYLPNLTTMYFKKITYTKGSLQKINHNWGRGVI